jgi:hypothetical protein
MTDTTTDLIARLDDVADALECFGEDKHPADIRKEAARDIREAIGTIERLSQQVAELKRENFALAAGQCIHDDGLSSDDGGTPYCKKQQRIAALESELAALANQEPVYPPAAVADWQAVCAEAYNVGHEDGEAEARAPATAAAEWISVDARLPDSGKTVLATYLNRCGKPRRIRAQYVAAKTREQNFDNDELDAEYDEASDTYYWKAGWYECIDNWPDYSHVAVCEGDVTHWTLMPDAPVAAEKEEEHG